MDPTGITQIIGIGKGIGEGARAFESLRRRFEPETSRFWKEFRKGLENDRDVPWSEIQARCELQPDFFGLMLNLALGMPGSDSAMRTFFESFVEPPPNGRYDKAKTIDRIMRIAEAAAVAAVPDDKKRDLATRRLLMSKMEEAAAEIKTSIEAMDDRLAGTDAAVAQLGEITNQILAHIESSSKADPTAQGAVDAEQMQALLEDQTSQIDERADKRMDELADRLALRLSQASDTPETDDSAARARAAQPPTGGDHLARLRESDRQAADRLEHRLSEQGVSGVADSISQGEFDDGPPELLVAAARVVTNDGFLSQAESAYLRAADLTDSDRGKARQYVRAAQVASIQGSEERYQRHLDAARELDAAHPALLIVEARASSDSEFMLDHVANVEPENPAETALLHQTRAQALLALGDEAAAQAEFDKARTADPESDAVREFGAILPWFHAQRQMEQGQPVGDAQPLVEAAATFEELAGDATRQGRTDEAAQVLTRAAHCLLLAEQRPEAIRTLEGISDPRRLSNDVAVGAAEMALLAGRPELARRFIPAGATDERARLLLADAQAQSDEPFDRATGVAALHELINSADPDIATTAAFTLLLGATNNSDIPWDEKAAQLVAEAKPETLALLEAEREALHENFDEAQRILLPYADRPSVLRRLRDYAAMAGQWGLARDRSQALLRQDADPRDRIATGEALRQLNEPSDARVAFATVANDVTAAPALRDAAFSAMVDLVSPNRDYEAILQLAREWRTALPESRGAAWNQAFALARLSRHADAWDLVRQLDLAAETDSQAALLGEVLYRAAPPNEAMRQLISLSDKFNRELEAIEAMIIATALDTEPEHGTFPPEIESRVRETFASFPTRFPNSDVITAVPAPETPGEIEAFLRELAGDTPQLRHEAAIDIERGSAPINAIAALSSGGIGQAWLKLSALPLAFATEHDLDLQAAQAAIGGAAVWDASALAVMSIIGSTTADRARTYLPGSVVVTETLEDADASARTPGKPWGQTVHMPSGEVGIREIPDSERAEDEALSERLLELARTLEVIPSRGDDPDAQLVSLWDDSDERPEFRALIGTLLAARRTGRPIYSDDRFIRAGARSLGLDAFGTLALVDALAERKLVDDGIRRAVRRALAVRGGWGVELSGDELIAIARDVHFELTSALRSVLNDRAGWRAKPSGRWQEVLALLTAVYMEAPQHLTAFVEATLDAAQRAAPEVRSGMWLEMMLLLAWSPGDGPVTDDRCFQALLASAKVLPPRFKPTGYDPVVHPLRSMLNSAPTRSRRLLNELFRIYLRRLRLTDQTHALYEMFDFDVRPPTTPGL